MPLIFPLYFLRFEVAGVPFTIVEGLVYLLFVGFLLTGCFDKRVFKEKVFWGVGLFFAAACISTLIVPEAAVKVDGTYTDSFNTALGFLKGFVFMPMLYLLMAWSFVKSDKERKYLLLALLWSGVWLSLWALYQVLTGNFVTIDGRASAFYESANYLALYLGPICVVWGISFLEAFRGLDFRKKKYFLVPGVLSFAAMFFAASYAGWIAVFSGIFFYVVLSNKFTRKLKVSAVAGAFLVFVLFALTQVGSSKFESFLEFEERSSTSARLQIWDASFDMITDHPILGIGLGQFELNYQWKMDELYGVETYEWLMPHPHNFLMGIWLNFGILGVLSMIGVLILAFSRVGRSDFKLVIASMLFAVLIHGLFDMPFLKNDLAMEFWLLILLLL